MSATFPSLRSMPPRRIAACPRTATPWVTASACCSAPEPSTYYLTCNTTAEPFNNADLRRGISLAINREAICKTIYKGTRTPADGIVPPGIDGYKEGAWEFCAYDVDKANEYLDKVAPAGR